MLLHPDPDLAEVPEFSPEQLERLTRSVERKKQKLEDDIKRYIDSKQEELKNYERELIAQYGSKECLPPRNAEREASSHADTLSPTSHSPSPSPSSSPATPAEPTEASSDSKKLGPEEKAKRTKHTRVHKREKELFGLVTPIFLPLLEAGESSPSPSKKKKEKKKQKEGVVEGVDTSTPTTEQGSPTRDADNSKENRRSRNQHKEENMEQSEDALAAAGSTKESQKADPGKKSKRAAVKKSSLRHNNTPRTRRKRVSLVIDDQIVHPADNITEPPLTSPSETTLSTASNSTASLDETLDPRLTSPSHQDPVHHSISRDAVPHSGSVPMAMNNTSPPEYAEHSLSESPPEEYIPPQTATRTFLDPSPSHPDLDIPQNASRSPIYASEPETAEAGEENFSTYVGGLSGSNVDDVDQAGSYGYPSSLGASYLESYMQSRPLSVRLAAAEKAELEESEKRKLIQGEKPARNDEEVETRPRKVESRPKPPEIDDDFEVMGEMDGF